MQTPITVKDKKSFIHWFLNNFQLKKRESVWILNYLVNHNEILENVHFVRDAKFCPRSIIITSYCSDEVPFRFYKNQLVTTDAEKSFHDIRLNQQDPLYIQINFKGAYQNILYVAVLEDNPFVPDEFFITQTDKECAKNLLEKTIYDYKSGLLKEKIDLALDKKNRTEFIHLTNDLRKLNKYSPYQPKQ